jgi:hypothetical protein
MLMPAELSELAIVFNPVTDEFHATKYFQALHGLMAGNELK